MNCGREKQREKKTHFGLKQGFNFVKKQIFKNRGETNIWINKNVQMYWSDHRIV